MCKMKNVITRIPGHIHILSQIICLGSIKNPITFLIPKLETGLHLSNIHQKCKMHYWHGHHAAQRDTKFGLSMGFDFQLMQT